MDKEGEIILYVDDSEESKEILEKLRNGNGSSKIQVVDVGKNGLRGWLLLEYGTMKTPLMVTERNVIGDPRRIVEHLEKFFTESGKK